MGVFDKIKEHRTHFLWAIIAAIIVPYIVDPITNLLSRLFIFFSQSITSFFLDSLYQDISRGKTDYSLLIVTITPFVFLGVLSSLMLRVLIKSQENMKQVAKVINVDFEKKKPVSIAIRMLLLGTTGIIMVAILVVPSNIKYSTIMTFEQKIKILTPYITPNEKDLLISKFSLMNSYQDYKNITAEIEQLAKEKNIMLPKQAYLSTY